MIKQIREYFNSKARAIDLNIKKDELMAKLIQETTNIVSERPEDGSWLRSGVTDREKGHLQTNQLEMVRAARRFYRWDSNQRAIIETLNHYIMGKGVTITPKEKDPMVWWVWREFWTADRNQMTLKQFELITRMMRDGEAFIELFSQADDSTETGKTTFRFLDPLLIKNPGGSTPDASQLPKGFKPTVTKNGIEHDPEDVETVIAYWVQSRTATDKFRKVPSERVVHVKIFADSDQKRGETYSQPVMKLFTHYRQWLENRMLLNKMRTAIVMIKKIEGTGGDVSRLAQTIGTSKRTGNSTKREQIRGGTVITAGPGVDYKMESPNINATDVKEDGRNIKLSMAAGTNMPEYIFGDASNANYASSLIAESPFVKGIEFWQMFVEFHWAKVFKKVIENAVKAGILDAPNDDEFFADMKKKTAEAKKNKKDQKLQEADPPQPPKGGKEGEPEEKKVPETDEVDLEHMETPTEKFYGIDASWPEVVHRDPKNHAESLQIARTNGWVSDPTASSALGYDWVEEVRKQNQAEDAAALEGNSLMGVKSAGALEDEEGLMDDEISAVLSGLSDEERRKILTSTDPKDLVSLISKHAPPKGKEK